MPRLLLVVLLLVAALPLIKACEFELPDLVVVKNGALPQISCAGLKDQYVAPLYNSTPMITLLHGSSFSVAIFNNSNFIHYEQITGVPAQCLNGPLCQPQFNASTPYDTATRYPYDDTFHVVPICTPLAGETSCTFAIYIKMNSDVPTGGPGEPAMATATIPMLILCVVSVILSLSSV